MLMTEVNDLMNLNEPSSENKTKNPNSRKSKKIKDADFLSGWQSKESQHIKRVRKPSFSNVSNSKKSKRNSWISVERRTIFSGSKHKKKSTSLQRERKFSLRKKPKSAVSRYKSKPFRICQDHISSYCESSREDIMRETNPLTHTRDDSYSNLKKISRKNSRTRKGRKFRFLSLKPGNAQLDESEKFIDRFIDVKLKRVIHQIEGGKTWKKNGVFKRKLRKMNNRSVESRKKKIVDNLQLMRQSLALSHNKNNKIKNPLIDIRSLEFKSIRNPFHQKKGKKKRKSISRKEELRQKLENNRVNNYLVTKKKEEKNSPKKKKKDNFMFRDKSFEKIVNFIKDKRKRYPGKRFDFKSPKFIMSKNSQKKFYSRGSYDYHGSKEKGINNNSALSGLRKKEPFRKFKSKKKLKGSKLMKKSLKEMLRSSVKTIKIDMREIKNSFKDK